MNTKWIEDFLLNGCRCNTDYPCWNNNKKIFGYATYYIIGSKLKNLGTLFLCDDVRHGTDVEMCRTKHQLATNVLLLMEYCSLLLISWQHFLYFVSHTLKWDIWNIQSCCGGCSLYLSWMHSPLQQPLPFLLLYWRRIKINLLLDLHHPHPLCNSHFLSILFLIPKRLF